MEFAPQRSIEGMRNAVLFDREPSDLLLLEITEEQVERTLRRFAYIDTLCLCSRLRRVASVGVKLGAVG